MLSRLSIRVNGKAITFLCVARRDYQWGFMSLCPIRQALYSNHWSVDESRERAVLIRMLVTRGR